MLQSDAPSVDARAQAEALVAQSEQRDLYPVASDDRADIIDALTLDFREMADLERMKDARLREIAAQTRHLSELLIAVADAVEREQT